MKIIELIIGDYCFDALIAKTEGEQTKGLMFVDPPFMPMIFTYDKSQINTFWMKNVKMGRECFIKRVLKSVPSNSN